MISLRDYVHDVDGRNMVSISHWGMYEIGPIPRFEDEVEDVEVKASQRDQLVQAIQEDFSFRMPSLMRQMKAYKEGVAAYANKIHH